MKKAFLFFAVAGLFVAPTLKAQESSVGIKGGINLSSISFDDYEEKNSHIGFNVGVFTKIAITEGYAIQPELQYSRQGVKAEFKGTNVESKFNLNYINLPVNMVFNLSENFELHFGPYVGYLINANVKTDGDIFGIDIDSDKDIDRKNFNSIDYGLTAGVAFNLKPVFVGLNYNYGLNQVAKDGEFSEDLLKDAANRVLQVYVGFKF